MHKAVKLFSLVLVFTLVQKIAGRSVEDHKLGKRSPQITLTIADDDDSEPKRGHPPSPEDLEARRQALVRVLGGSGSSGEGSGGGISKVIQELLGGLGNQDIVGNALNNTRNIFEPLRNATRKATEGYPRVGTVVNRVVDTTRDYRRKVTGGVRETLGVIVNNFIRLFTTFSARGTQVLGGVFRIVREVLDKLTLAVTNLAQNVSRGIQSVTQGGARFLARNLDRARSVITSGKIFAPAKVAIQVGRDTAKGISEDLTQAQPWVAEGLKSKLVLGNALVPRVPLARILSPLGDAENSPAEGFNSKRESTGGTEERKEMSLLDILGLDVGEELTKTDDEELPSESKTNEVESKDKSNDLIKMDAAEDEKNSSTSTTATEKATQSTTPEVTASSTTTEEPETPKVTASSATTTTGTVTEPSNTENNVPSKGIENTNSTPGSVEELFGLTR